MKELLGGNKGVFEYKVWEKEEEIEEPEIELEDEIKSDLEDDD